MVAGGGGEGGGLHIPAIAPPQVLLQAAGSSGSFEESEPTHSLQPGARHALTTLGSAAEGEAEGEAEGGAAGGAEGGAESEAGVIRFRVRLHGDSRWGAASRPR